MSFSFESPTDLDALGGAAARYTKRWPEHAAKLEAAAVRCETEGTREACDSARAVAHAADAAYAAYAAYARARDRALAAYAEWVVEILIDMQAPGCQWLDLTPKISALPDTGDGPGAR